MRIGHPSGRVRYWLLEGLVPPGTTVQPSIHGLQSIGIGR